MALQEAVGDQFTVMMQVRVGSLLSVPATEWKRWGRRVAQKSFDFALVKKGSSYVAGVIELDDKTHLLRAAQSARPLSRRGLQASWLATDAVQDAREL